MPGPKTSAQRSKLRVSHKEDKGNSLERVRYWMDKRRGKIRRLLARAIKYGRIKKALTLRNALGALT